MLLPLGQATRRERRPAERVQISAGSLLRSVSVADRRGRRRGRAPWEIRSSLTVKEGGTGEGGDSSRHAFIRAAREKDQAAGVLEGLPGEEEEEHTERRATTGVP